MRILLQKTSSLLRELASSPWITRGFLHGFVLPIVSILPVHGLEFALYRSSLDLVLRGHIGDGIGWAGDFRGTIPGMAVSLLLVAVVAGDVLRRWIVSWKRNDGNRLEFFWSGLVAGAAVYLALRQIGTLMQWRYAGSQVVCGIRFALSGSVAVWIATSVARSIHPGSGYPFRARWIGIVAVCLVASVVSVRWMDLLCWNLERTALRTGRLEDYDQWLFRTRDPLVRDRIRSTALADVRSWGDLAAWGGFDRREGDWGAWEDSLEASRKVLFRKRVGDLATVRLSNDPDVDRIWHGWIREAGDSARPRSLRLVWDWDRERLVRFLDGVRRRGGPSIDPDKALPLGGGEWPSATGAFSGLVSSMDSAVLRFDPRFGNEQGEIRVSIVPFLAGSGRPGARPSVGFRWTAVLGPGTTDSAAFEFASCDTVIGSAKPGICPEGGDFDQDSVHSVRREAIRWGDPGAGAALLEGFLRDLWRMGK